MLPLATPDGGDSELSTYLHLMLNYLEHQVLARVIGQDRADRVVQFWCEDHYRWIYRAVVERGPEIRSILESNELLEGCGVA